MLKKIIFVGVGLVVVAGAVLLVGQTKEIDTESVLVTNNQVVEPEENKETIEAEVTASDPTVIIPEQDSAVPNETVPELVDVVPGKPQKRHRPKRRRRPLI